MRIKIKNISTSPPKRALEHPFFVFLSILIIFLFSNGEKVYANISSLYLEPSLQTVGVGDTFSLNVDLNNTDSTGFDTLSIWISFNSLYLEVLDSDAGTGGTQIKSDPDSTYHFSWIPINNADNTNGKIDWRAGSFSNIYSTGRFAEISFKALGVVENNPIDFIFSPTWGYEPSTHILDNGIDVLASSENHTDGVFGASVTVVPEPITSLLFCTGAIPILYLFRKRR